MKDRTRTWAVVAGVACALLSIAFGSSRVLLALAACWAIGSTAVAFSCGAAVRALLDGPDMYPRSMKAIARAADDPHQSRVNRRTAVALYLYMAGMFFSAGAMATILWVSFVFFRQ